MLLMIYFDLFFPGSYDAVFARGIEGVVSEVKIYVCYVPRSKIKLINNLHVKSRVLRQSTLLGDCNAALVGG